MMNGELPFVGLPLCFSSQIGEVLMQSGKIVKIHAPYDFKVSESLEFYDARNGRILPRTHFDRLDRLCSYCRKGAVPALIRVFNKRFKEDSEQNTKEEEV